MTSLNQLIRNNSHVLVILSLLLLSGCLNMQNEQKGKIIAKVGDRVMYSSFLDDKIPAGISGNDSIALAEKLTTRWVKDQLLREKAALNLPEKERDIEEQVDNFRTSLLIHKYQQMLINQKLDTSINESDIKKYYEQHKGQYKLDENIVKAYYINVPKSAPQFYRISYWYQSDKDEDYNKMDEFCDQYANEYSLDDKWTPFEEINKKIPVNITNPTQYLKYNKYIIAYDSLNYYYVRLLDYKLINDTTPLQFVSKQIRNVLLNRKKIDFIHNVENNMYQNALNRQKIEIY